MKHNDPEPMINLGASICDQLKFMYYPDTPWIECYKLVAGKFTEVKKAMRKMLPDKTDIQIAQELIKYRREDIEDIMP